jgi:hypothetical protein
MPIHITTEEAKRQGLPGFDTYRYTHLLYHDDLNRDHGVFRLNEEALKAFSDTVSVTHRHALAAEQAAEKEWLRKGGFNSDIPYPFGDVTGEKRKYLNYENLKIACGFELHLKARLLGRDFIVHEIDPKPQGCKSLAEEQRTRPITKRELFAVQPYRFDGNQNYLPGLKEGSIKFSWLTDKPTYRSALGLSGQQLDIIKDYRNLRNQIHFPGDILEAPNIRAYPNPIIEFLVGFINSEIVNGSNALIVKHSMHYQPLTPFD